VLKRPIPKKRRLGYNRSPACHQIAFDKTYSI
jgi:hypothetical protein